MCRTHGEDWSITRSSNVVFKRCEVLRVITSECQREFINLICCYYCSQTAPRSRTPVSPARPRSVPPRCARFPENSKPSYTKNPELFYMTTNKREFGATFGPPAENARWRDFHFYVYDLRHPSNGMWTSFSFIVLSFHADQGLPRYFQVEVTTTPQHIRLILMQRIQKKKKGFAQVARLVTEGIIHTPPR